MMTDETQEALERLPTAARRAGVRGGPDNGTVRARQGKRTRGLPSSSRPCRTSRRSVAHGRFLVPTLKGVSMTIALMRAMSLLETMIDQKRNNGSSVGARQVPSRPAGPERTTTKRPSRRAWPARTRALSRCADC